MEQAEVVIKSGSKLKAAPGYVIVEPLKPMQESEGGIVLPAIAQQKTCEGRVVDHSPGPQQFAAMEVFEYKPDELVIWARYSEREYKIGERLYAILREEDIIATIVEEEK